MNTTTKAQRTNKRQDAIWEKAKRANTGKPILDALIDASESLADKSAHTPGPWKTAFRWQGGNGIDAYVSIVSKDQGVSYAFGNTEGEREANARLIAAAPDLLQALKGVAWKIHAYGSHWEPSQAEREQIANVIAKAEGSAQ